MSSPIHLIKDIIIILRIKLVATIMTDIAMPSTLPLNVSEIYVSQIGKESVSPVATRCPSNSSVLENDGSFYFSSQKHFKIPV